MLKIKVKKTITGFRQFYYVIVGGNGEPMATSQMYPRKASAKRAGLALIAHGLKARIDDSDGKKPIKSTKKSRKTA